MRKIRTIKDSNTIISEMLEIMLVCVNKLKEGLEMLSDQHSKLQEENRTQEKIKNRQEVTLIHGVSGLAKHLGCGKNKAQNILNSNILQEEGIAYRVGNRWIINPNSLDGLLAENPEILKCNCVA
ncbi:MAG: hypothetical protein PUH44_00965 [Bacteroidales bacterium]|nr:hypothetical protein [Bacteroidales bacterium]MDY2705344.1 hypothetical protein [Alloprevotella sp.]MDY2914599.1 hypothetical protein [Alloprevotella sp.]